jgi:flagellar assembly protein FliH
LSKALLGQSEHVRDFSDLLQPVAEARALLATSGRLRGLELVREEAKQRGFTEGYEEGFALGREQGRTRAYEEASEATAEEICRIAGELDQLGQDMHAALNEWYRQSEESLARLSVEIARRLVAKELETSEEAILSITREALEEVTHAATARIKVNPAHSAILENYIDQFQSLAPSLKSIEIVDDPSVGSGCVIETDGGVVDASIESKLRNIVEAARVTR